MLTHWKTALHHAHFLGGSVLCAGINNLILIAGATLGFGYVPLTFLCYAVSGSVGYVYHCKITFHQPMTVNGYFSFIVSISLGLPVSLCILAVLSDWLAFSMWIAAPVMTVIMFGYHYFVARLTITSRFQSQH